MRRSSALLLAYVTVLALAAGCGGGTPAPAPMTPDITSIEPASGGAAGGTFIVIRGTNLSNPQPGEYAVLIGGQPADEIVVVSDTEVECRTPSGAEGPADVEVITIEGDGVVPGGFTYHPPPTVTAITPDEGSRDGGTPITVTGTGFAANDPGKMICLIEMKALTDVVVVDDTTLTGVTPSSWTEVSKDVKVVNRNGTGTLARGWTYVGPVPLIFSLTPTQGPRTGGTAVTVTGDFFTEAGGDVTIRFGDEEAVVGPYIDDQTRTCVTPLSFEPGLKDVTVGNNNGESTLPDGFYYLPEPQPTAITPDEGTIDGGTSVTITGGDFSEGTGTTVLFGAKPATNVVVLDDSTITCDTPAGSILESVTVVVQNSNGLGSIPDGYTYIAPAFWWEDTFGTAATLAGAAYTTVEVVSLPNGFPFFDEDWDSVNALALGYVSFGASDNYFVNANTLHPFPHITAMGCVLNPTTSLNMYSTSHVPGRTIITYDRVAEYLTEGANSVQIHLHQSGIFAIVYKSATFYIGFNNPAGALTAVNPGGGTNVPVDWSSGPQSGGPTDALNEIFPKVAAPNDLSGGYLTFVPNASGGYDSTYTSGVPTDPNP